MKLGGLGVAILVLISSQFTAAVDTPANDNQVLVDSVIKSFFKISDQICKKSVATGLKNLRNLTAVLNEFKDPVIKDIDEFLINSSKNNLTSFKENLMKSLNNSLLDIPNKHIPEFNKTFCEFYANYSQVANKTIKCRFDAFIKFLKNNDANNQSCYTTKFQSNLKVLIIKVALLYQDLDPAMNDFMRLTNDLMKKIQKWSREIKEGLQYCLGSIHKDCCIDEFIRANGTIILNDINITKAIPHIIWDLIINPFTDAPAKLIKTIGDNYDGLGKEMTKCIPK
ncbi:unnamed protein product [Diamesa serratosioi]